MLSIVMEKLYIICYVAFRFEFCLSSLNGFSESTKRRLKMISDVVVYHMDTITNKTEKYSIQIIRTK